MEKETVDIGGIVESLLDEPLETGRELGDLRKQESQDVGVNVDKDIVETIKKDDMPLDNSTETFPIATAAAPVTSREEEDSIIFHCVSFLGAAKIQVRLPVKRKTVFIRFNVI